MLTKSILPNTGNSVKDIEILFRNASQYYDSAKEYVDSTRESAPSIYDINESDISKEFSIKSLINETSTHNNDNSAEVNNDTLDNNSIVLDDSFNTGELSSPCQSLWETRTTVSIYRYTVYIPILYVVMTMLPYGV